MAEGTPKELVHAAASLRAAHPSLYDVFVNVLQDHANSLSGRRFRDYSGSNEGLWQLKGAAAQVQFLVDSISAKAVNEYDAAQRAQQRG